MTLRTLARFLIGRADAILTFAYHPQALVVGLALVLATALARNYDTEDLLHEPWHLLGSFAAALIGALVLYGLLRIAGRGRRSADDADADVPPPPPFIAFLRLYLMTAPLGLLYGIPVEHLFSPVAAVTVNLWFLAIVSVWRVLLITRCASVLFGLGVFRAFFIVMLFADAAALIAMNAMPQPIFAVMGGIDHTASDEQLLGIMFLVVFFGVVTAPIWIIGSLIVLAQGHVTARPAPLTTFASARPLLLTAVIVTLVWIPGLVINQPAQFLRHEVETHLQRGEIRAALRAMSGRARADYPPHWTPPPRLGWTNSLRVDLDEVCAVLEEEPIADWVSAEYVRKIARDTKRDIRPFFARQPWPDIDEAIDYLGIEGIGDEQRARLEFILDRDPELTDADRTAIRSLIEYVPPADDPTDERAESPSGA